MKILSDILEHINVEQISGRKDMPVTGISFNSQEVKPGHIFVAVVGTRVDGHDFIGEALEKGAVVIACEKLPAELKKNISYLKVNESNEILGLLSSAFYDYPSSKLKVIGVTGTNGKTSVAVLLFNLFKQSGFKTGLISTINTCIDDKILKSSHTTPDSLKISKLLSEMVNEGCKYCFMEVSSHALVQKRIAGLKFSGGIFTNITHDHLDYHKSFDEYIKVKKSFFDELQEGVFALLNADDKNAKIISQNTSAKKISYAVKSPADYKCRVIESHFDGTLINIEGNEIWIHLVGDFNVSNILAVYACALLLGLKKEDTLKTISDLKAVRARFEYYRSKDGIVAVVDYAHTPDALKNVLKTINKIKNGGEQVITIVGAGGDRDKKKRPEMGKIAAEQSDKVIFTSDNPRSENPEDIVNDMLGGVNSKHLKKIVTILNRKEAIKTACLWAKKGDIVLVAGKGHETYQEIEGVRYEFDDKKVLNEVLNI